jgi:acyl carrier protein
MADNAQPVSLAISREEPAIVRRELATLIIEALNLDVSPEDIDPDTPLYGEGLGLDSIDILEIALVLAKQYGIHLQADSEENHAIFRSLNTLSMFVVTHRTR